MFFQPSLPKSVTVLSQDASASVQVMSEKSIFEDDDLQSNNEDPNDTLIEDTGFVSRYELRSCAQTIDSSSQKPRTTKKMRAAAAKEANATNFECEGRRSAGDVHPGKLDRVIAKEIDHYKLPNAEDIEGYWKERTDMINREARFVFLLHF
ncbi:hypothetical protein VC83_02789 [Pseudogymnoascus destructans]|uniref:Uncharacterized protein n=1 Tax=Pseudogymnoascus destructans TaxID=655981 RepID=A0A177ADI1_9PEZI|nr:uncharacterized protein VC83_02789 [Pseudogymnoascus destructans]OAF60148.2 hypothetical protein VC83_02789 [Pseudogymnoascus destructans]